MLQHQLDYGKYQHHTKNICFVVHDNARELLGSFSTFVRERLYSNLTP